MRAVRSTWTIGGIGLVLCAVVGMLSYAVNGSGPVIAVAGEIIFAASVLVFAIGSSAGASVVARRPLGIGALVVVALWPLLIRGAHPFLPAMGQDTFESGLDAYLAAENVLTAVFFVNLIVPLAAALVAVVEIARAGVVPRPWRWAPLWALAASVTAAVLPQLVFATTAAQDAQALAGVVTALGLLGLLARTLGLGIIALVLAAQIREGDVEVYRSA